MQVKPKFKVKIGRDGKITMTVEGVTGSECVALTKEMVEKLGKVESQELTAEYYENPPDQLEAVRQHG